MSYVPLHHKYRPQSFRELVGQEAIANTLSNALNQDKIAPAYLFTGPRGTGKTSSARILAKSLNCQSGDAPTADPCGNCETCRAITKGASLDVIEIDAASNTGVDNIRELIERAQFAPVQCRYKVYVIDECHMLSTAAFNSLLKTLEEPPARVIFVLATTDPQRVLATIISRCQRFDFRRIPLEAMVQHLKKIAANETISITDEAIALVAQIAQGGLRDAESLLDQLSLLSEEVTPEKVWDLVGSVPERDLLELLKAIASNHGAHVLDVTRSILDRGREPLIVLQNLVSFYRDVLIARTSPDRNDLVALTPPTWASLCEFAQKFEISTLLKSQQHLKNSEVQLKNTTQPRLWLEVTLLGLLPDAINPEPALRPVERRDFSPSPLTKAETNGKQLAAVSPPQPTPVQPEPPPQSAPVQPTPPVQSEPPPQSDAPPVVSEQPAASIPQSEELKDLWPQILERIQPHSTQALVRQHGRLLSIEDDVAIIGIKTGALLKLLQGKEKLVEAALVSAFNRPLKVHFVVSSLDSSSPASNASLPSRPKEVKLPPDSAPEALNPPIARSPSNGNGTQPPAEPPPVTETVQPSIARSPSNGNGTQPPSETVPPPIARSQPSNNGNSDAIPTHSLLNSAIADDLPAQNLAPPPAEVRQEEVLMTQACKSFAEYFKGEAIAPKDSTQSSEATTASQFQPYLKGEFLESDRFIDLEDSDEDIPF